MNWMNGSGSLTGSAGGRLGAAAPRRRGRRFFPTPGAIASAVASAIASVTFLLLFCALVFGGGDFGTGIGPDASGEPMRAFCRFASFTASRLLGPRTGVRGVKNQP